MVVYDTTEIHDFQIMIDDFWNASYQHRLDFTQLSHIILSGDVVAEKISHIQPNGWEDKETEKEVEEDESEEDTYEGEGL